MQFNEFSLQGGSPGPKPNMPSIIPQGNMNMRQPMGGFPQQMMAGAAGPQMQFQPPGGPQGFNPNLMQQQQQSIPQQQMGMNPQEAKKPSLKVTLTDKEKGYYSNLLMQADPSGNNKVGGQQGVAFFKRSGISTDLLKQIWLISARTSNEFLTRDEFYVALRLIAYAQNGIQVNEDSIKFNIDVALPRFESAPLALPAPEIMRPEVRAEDIAAALPDLDSLDIGALNSIQSLIPSINQKEQERHMKIQQQQMMKQQQIMHQQLTINARSSQWFLQEEDKVKYQKIFAMFDKQNAGFIHSSQMKDVFEQTKLDKSICDAVWNLVNPMGKDKFDKTMFMITMHFLYKKKASNIELPAMIPEETYISIDGENYFRNAQMRQQQNMVMMNQMNQGVGMQPQNFQTQAQPMQAPFGGNNMDQSQQRSQFQSEHPLNSSPPQKQQQDLLSFGDNPSVAAAGLQSSFNGLSLDPQQQRAQQIEQLKQTPVKINNFATAIQGGPGMIGAGGGARSLHHSPRSASIRLDPAKVNQRQEEIAFLNQIHSQDLQYLNDLQTDNLRLQNQIDELDREFISLKQKIEQQRQLIQQEKTRNSQFKSQYDDKSNQVYAQRQVYDAVVNERANTEYNNYGGYNDYQNKESYGTYNNQYNNYNNQDYGGASNTSAHNANNGYYQENDYSHQNTSQQNQYQQDYSHANNTDAQYINQQSNNDQNYQHESKNVGSSNFAARFDFDNFDNEVNHNSGQGEFNNRFEFV